VRCPNIEYSTAGSGEAVAEIRIKEIPHKSASNTEHIPTSFPPNKGPGIGAAIGFAAVDHNKRNVTKL